LDGVYGLAVIDGVTDSMGLFGLFGKDADDVARWHRTLPKAVASKTGAAVVCVDHVAKDSQTRGRFALGSQHKMAGLTPTAKLSVDQSFHSLRHTYASLCLAAGIRPIDIAELMGHRDVKTTLTVYAHLINTDDHAGNMAVLGALAAPKPSYSGNVIPLHG